MNRRFLAVFAIVASVLVAFHAPAVVGQTSDTLVVGSQHTDFGTGQEAPPQELQNMTIEGSDDSATIRCCEEEVSRAPDNDGSGSSTSERTGLKINTNKQVSEITVNLSQDTSGATKVYITDTAGTTIASANIVNGQATISANLAADTDYYVLVDAEGATYTRGFTNQVNFPVNGAAADITRGVEGGTVFSGAAFSIRSLKFDALEGTYRSANHSVSKPSKVAINITQLSNVSVDAQVRTDGGTTLGSDTITSTGNHTIALSDSSSESLETVLNVTVTGDNPQFELSDESILFNNSAPTVDNSSASPTGEIQQQAINLSIDASDAQFGSAQGEQLTATFYVEGESVGADTLSSNGTASISYSTDMGGNKSWYVVVNDSYGASTTSDTFEFSAPSSITFRQEENPDQLVDDATVQVTTYYSGEVQRRTVTNGQLNLTGFPIDEPIIVRSNASGYYTRTVVLESIYEQSNVYLLNSSQPTYTSRFELQDLTGEYPEGETILVIERDLKLNGSTGWRAIAGDNFGVNGVSASLVQGERYRLRIKNLETGRTSVIGAYTAIQSETVTVSTGSATIELPESDTAYSWAVTQNDSTDTIKFRYLDEENSTQEVKLTIHERFNKSNVLVDNVSFTGANEINYQRQLTANETNTTWMAEIYIDRGDGFMHFRAPTSGGQQSLLPADLDQVWVSAIGVFIVLISSLAFSQLNLGVGAISTALTGGMLWWFGLLDTVATGPTIVAAIMIAVVFHYYSASPGGGA